MGCLWILIGKSQMYDHNDGWIVNNVEVSKIQDSDFQSLYITSVYWVITTFSSVGYGDVYGHTKYENKFQMLVQMIGIAMFGYMTGTF